MPQDCEADPWSASTHLCGRSARPHVLVSPSQLQVGRARPNGPKLIFEDSCRQLVFAFAFVFALAVTRAGIGSAGPFSDPGGMDVAQELLIQLGHISWAGMNEGGHPVLDQCQRGDEAEIERCERLIFGGLGHDPANHVAEQELGVDFLEDASRRMGSQVLDIQAVLPFAIDGFDGPASMIEINQFVPVESIGIHQAGQQPAWTKALFLIADQAARELIRQSLAFMSTAGGRMEADDPILGSKALHSLGKSGCLMGNPHEEVSPA